VSASAGILSPRPLELARLAARRVNQGSRILAKIPRSPLRKRYYRAKDGLSRALEAAGLQESIQVEYQGANRLERLTFNIAGESYSWHVPRGGPSTDRDFIGPRRQWRNKRRRPAAHKTSEAAAIAPELEEWIAEAVELLEFASQTLAAAGTYIGGTPCPRNQFELFPGRSLEDRHGDDEHPGCHRSTTSQASALARSRGSAST